MPSKIIELGDGTLVEVAAAPGESREISGGFTEKVNSTLEQLRPVLAKACEPVLEMCRDLKADNRIDSAEVELGFSFAAEGNLFIAKATSNASVVVKLQIKN
ncbi:hypothetical protein BLA60_33000 [Actinophytocola xinjiangensis]|jgi:hypothetical protein|uniref:Trypsin-co-occurring domain-containing protein n=1 Tax=Actinophytocola xinjiangensis TaxID=485602 RepID=A0A7Z1AVV1_9PSEU|nr:CU044_2847 family protein [Actinophytocola xinjiangensis]OLF06156.1 hypothetical protein BLA60_33000 [Actinophytocola xinjiangensis]